MELRRQPGSIFSVFFTFTHPICVQAAVGATSHLIYSIVVTRGFWLPLLEQFYFCGNCWTLNILFVTLAVAVALCFLMEIISDKRTNFIIAAQHWSRRHFFTEVVLPALTPNTCRLFVLLGTRDLHHYNSVVLGEFSCTDNQNYVFSKAVNKRKQNRTCRAI